MNGMPTLRLLARWAGFPTKLGEMKGLGKMLKKIFQAVCRLRVDSGSLHDSSCMRTGIQFDGLSHFHVGVM